LNHQGRKKRHKKSAAQDRSREHRKTNHKGVTKKKGLDQAVQAF
jgi:hypothetical protein